MAAYAALVSLMNIIDTLQLHPRPPISLHIKQVHSLTQKLTFLQEFLQGYNPYLGYTTEADPLESRIADAAHAAEDAIESNIVDQIRSAGEKMSFDTLYEALEKVIEEMTLIQKEAVEVKETVGVQHQLHTPPDSERSSSSIAQKKSSMVGADNVLLQMKDKLTSDRLDLQVISIVGMGGTGKTTLARTIYEERLIMEHFDICTWVTISQEYSIREIFTEVLCQLNQDIGDNLSENVLGEKLYKHLYGRRYLIIMDDIWSIDAWDRVRIFFPDNKNGSRIVVTTRLSNLASKLPNSNSLEMNLLDEDESWELLSKTVFGEEKCPIELEEIGKQIGKNCKGLPLSIVVIGGVLAKSKQTKEVWEYIEENLNSIVNSEDDEHCLKILHLSYKQLPVYLKPCFLYMGVFPEDEEICISKLIKLWVAEGFLKPISGKSLEEIAKDYLEDLIGRNLVLSHSHESDSIGSIKKCKIHDLLRDLCLREAQKERFYTLTLQGIVNVSQRRFVISNNEDISVLSSMSVPARSLIWNPDKYQALPVPSLGLLRIFDSHRYGYLGGEVFLREVHKLVNSRFLDFKTSQSMEWSFPYSFWQFWNLQTLIVHVNSEVTAPTDIWYMTQIRHIQINSIHLPDPPNGQDDIVLRNLQTLREVTDLKCSERVVKRIPNVKRLKIVYYDSHDYDTTCLNNLDCLDKLESLTCHFHKVMNPSGPVSVESQINFPHSLKKLNLKMHRSVCWQDVLDKIGVLPLLQKLNLINGRFKEGRWETIEGQFRSLKLLGLYRCYDLRVWTTESSHFPRLEHLILCFLEELDEVPLDFAETSTLREIEVGCCNDSVVVSAKRILDEQEELYGEEEALQVRVWLADDEDEALKSLASPNFHVQC